MAKCEKCSAEVPEGTVTCAACAAPATPQTGGGSSPANSCPKCGRHLGPTGRCISCGVNVSLPKPKPKVDVKLAQGLHKARLAFAASNQEQMMVRARTCLRRTWIALGILLLALWLSPWSTGDRESGKLLWSWDVMEPLTGIAKAVFLAPPIVGVICLALGIFASGVIRGIGVALIGAAAYAIFSLWTFEGVEKANESFRFVITSLVLAPLALGILVGATTVRIYFPKSVTGMIFEKIAAVAMIALGSAVFFTTGGGSREGSPMLEQWPKVFGILSGILAFLNKSKAAYWVGVTALVGAPIWNALQVSSNHASSFSTSDSSGALLILKIAAFAHIYAFLVGGGIADVMRQMRPAEQAPATASNV